MIFELSEDEKKRALEWAYAQNDKYFKDNPTYFGPIGGGLTYEITPTTVGENIIVRHNATQETLDLTDYENM